MNTEVKETEINEFELEQLPILPLKDLSFFDDEEEKTKDYENLGKIKLSGLVKFTSLPDDKKDTFRFSLISGSQTRTLEITAKTVNNTSVPLSDGENYIFSCDEPINDIYIVKHYKTLEGLSEADVFEPKFIRALDTKILGLEIISDANRCSHDSLIGLSIFGYPRNIISNTETGIITFNFDEQNTGRSFRMKFNPKMNHGITENEFNIKEGHLYLVDSMGVLGGDAYCVIGLFTAEEKIEKLFGENGEKKVKEYYRMNQKQKQEILTHLQKSSRTYDIIDKNQVAIFKTDDELIEKYRILQHIYPPEVQRAIESLITSPILVEQQKTKALSVLINTPWSQRVKLNTDYSFLKKELDRTHFAQETVKNYIIATLIDYEAKIKNKGKAFVLVGPPGVGKTSLLMSAARACGLPYSKISVNGITTPCFLKGTPRLYNNATYGQIISKLNQLGTRCLLIIDEIDKMCGSHDGDPYSALYDLLDPNECFQDEFIEEGIPKQDVLFSFTANSLSNIPKPILDRLEIISVDDYTIEEKRVILTDYIIPKELEQYYDPGLQFSEEAITKILNSSSENGVRALEKIITRLISSALLFMKKQNKNSFIIDEHFVCQVMGQKIYQNTNTHNIKIGF